MTTAFEDVCSGRYLSDQVLVLHHSQLSARRLGDPFPGHQVADQHGGGANVHWTDCKTDSDDVSGADRQTRKRFCSRRCGGSTWLLLPGLGHVGHAGVGAHEDVAGVQVSFQEALLGVTDVDSSQWRLGKRVGRHEGEAVQPHLVDAVDGLRGKQFFWGVF